MAFDDWDDEDEQDGGVDEPFVPFVVATDDSGWESIEQGLQDRVASIFKCRERGTVVEWAEGEPDPGDGSPFRPPVIIPAGGGQPKPGAFSTRNGPVMREPMNWLSDPRVREITLKIAAQVGKSRLLCNVVGYIVDWEPGPITVIYPNDDTAQVKMKEDFAPFFQANKNLRDKLIPDEEGEKKSKLEKSTMMRWTFPGGWLRFVSGASTSKTAASPAQYVILDEAARIKDTREGDVSMAAFMRQPQFANPKLIRASTPVGGAKTCKITQAYNRSDMSVPYVFCPNCGHDHVMQWEYIRIGRNTLGEKVPEGSVYVCPQCQYAMGDAVRYAMLQGVKWRQTAKFSCCEAIHDPVMIRTWDDDGVAHCPTCDAEAPCDHRGGDAAGYYAYGVGLHDMVRQFLDAKDDPALMMQFVNQRLSRSFEPPRLAEGIADTLAESREDYQEIWGPGVEVPGYVIVLVMGVDVQGNRLEWNIRGYGLGMESWGIRAGVIMGDPKQGHVWDELELIRRKYWQGTDRRLYKVALTGIDIGQGEMAPFIMKYILGKTDSGIPRTRDGVIPIRGLDIGPIFDPKVQTEGRARKFPHHQIGTNLGKDMLTQRFLIKYPKKEDLEDMPADMKVPHVPLMMHWPQDIVDPSTGQIILDTGYGGDHFAQLTNFKRVWKKLATGERVEVWDTADKSVAEEALDTTLYCNGLVYGVLKRAGVERIEDLTGQWRYAEEDLADEEFRSKIAHLVAKPLPKPGPTTAPVPRPKAPRVGKTPQEVVSFNTYGVRERMRANRPDARKRETAA